MFDDGHIQLGHNAKKFKNAHFTFTNLLNILNNRFQEMILFQFCHTIMNFFHFCSHDDFPTHQFSINYVL